jgi:hypothetical protein
MVLSRTALANPNSPNDQLPTGARAEPTAMPKIRELSHQ